MALTRKFLSALGIEAEKVDEIIDAHTETVNGLKAEIETAKEGAEDSKKLESENKRLKSELATLKEAAEKPDTYKVKYEAIKEEFEEYKKGIETEKSEKSKRDAFKAFLKELGISEKRLDSVIKVSDLSKIKLDDDGKVKDEDGKLAESLKKEWEDFIVVEHSKGADTSKPPKNDGGTDADDGKYAAQRAAKYYADKYGAPQTKEEK